jgi:hypothetical protein
MRIGFVQASPPPQADFVSVLVDGTVIQAVYFTGYVPVPGDRVIVTQDGIDWFVVGGRSGFAGNLVLNADMVQGPHASLSTPALPFHWTQCTTSGSAGQVFRYRDPGRSRPALLLSKLSGGAGDNAFVSAPTPEFAGETL